MSDHFVRIGLLGHVGRFLAVDPIRVPRGARVVCRTNRGLEVGEVLAHPIGTAPRGSSDGSLLRTFTPTDDLWLQRLGKNRNAAFAACQQLLQRTKSNATLIDVEPLFDGRSIYFYFLEPPSPEVETWIESLAAEYESQARIRDFTKAVEAGCGPACGTDEAAGCGTSCSTCAVAGACRTSGENTSLTRD